MDKLLIAATIAAYFAVLAIADQQLAEHYDNRTIETIAAR